VSVHKRGFFSLLARFFGSGAVLLKAAGCAVASDGGLRDAQREGLAWRIDRRPAPVGRQAARLVAQGELSRAKSTRL
jgi:hypothetical protein